MKTSNEDLLKQAVINLTLENVNLKNDLKTEKKESKELLDRLNDLHSRKNDSNKKTTILLNGAEIQSGSNRQKHAEHLISQLCKDHDGRNTWLLNYGVGEEAVKAREVRSIRFDDLTQSAETIKS